MQSTQHISKLITGNETTSICVNLIKQRINDLLLLRLHVTVLQAPSDLVPQLQ